MGIGPSSSYNLTLDGASIDGKVSKISEELLSAVLALDELEEVGGIVDELRVTKVSSEIYY